MDILVSFWGVLAMMAPWLLGGFLLAGVVSIFLPEAWVEKTMGKSRGWRGILNAVLIGVPLPVCSCGVLPLTAGLRKAGAGKGASAAFLISTPQTGLDSILATYSLLGPFFAVARPLAALLTGLVGGLAVDLVANRDEGMPPPEAPKKCCCCCCHKNSEQVIVNSEQVGVNSEQVGGLCSCVVRILRKADELLGEIVRPLLVGLLIAASVTVLVPENFLADVFGGRDWLAMPAMVLIGFPMYVCSTASIPIALSLILKGLSPGAAFVFLMVGPAINAASLATVAKLIGLRATVLYALVIALGSVACGVLINLLPIDGLEQAASCCAGESVSWFEHGAALLLLALVVRRLLPVCGARCHGLNDHKEGHQK